jgi:hypothetical protein
MSDLKPGDLLKTTEETALLCRSGCTDGFAFPGESPLRFHRFFAGKTVKHTAQWTGIYGTSLKAKLLRRR